MKKFYLTTTTPYVNADPHIGFAMELIRADVIVRYHRELLKEDVVFNTGTDEHGQKIYQKALEERKKPQEYCDEHAKKFKALKDILDVSVTNFIRTTDTHHVQAAQEFWKLCDQHGDIYKARYKINYCVGCELEKTDSELVDGTCPLHPTRPLEEYDEENYFFRFSKYQKKLLDFYKSNPSFVLPLFRYEEIKNFVRSGLKDFSISRMKSKMPWGIDVPDDEKHVMYVWFDALINYISTLGWPSDRANFENYWPGMQIAGKDNLRQQTAMWQAMLMSAGLPNSKQIYIEGFITSEGQKMSKSLGNVVDPVALVKKYGVDAVRYYLLREIPSYGDGDFSERRFKELYNADLANGLGNLVSRVAKLSETSGLVFENDIDHRAISKPVEECLNQYKFDDALEIIWAVVDEANHILNKDKPWHLTGDALKASLFKQVKRIRQIAYELKIFLPSIAENIYVQFKGPKITTTKPLFPRLS